MPGDSYENALRAARELWMEDSVDFARRDVLDQLWSHHINKLLDHGICMGMGWIKLRELAERNSADENWSVASVSPGISK